MRPEGGTASGAFGAVIFDLWQTLVPWPHDAAESYYRWMADAYGAPYKRFHDAWTSSFRERLYVLPVRGHLSSDEDGAPFGLDRQVQKSGDRALAVWKELDHIAALGKARVGNRHQL